MYPMGRAGASIGRSDDRREVINQRSTLCSCASPGVGGTPRARRCSKNGNSVSSRLPNATARGSWPNDAGGPFHEHVQQKGGARLWAFPPLTSFGRDLDTISLPPPASIGVTGLIIYP